MNSQGQTGSSKWRAVFVAVAGLAITGPIAVALNFREDITRAFTNPGWDEAIYWQAGTIGVFALFGLLAFYMGVSGVKMNVTKYSKAWAVLLLPLLAFVSVGGFALVALNQVPTARGPYLSWTNDPKTTMTITWEQRSFRDDYALEYGTSEAALGLSASANCTTRREDDGYYHYTATLSSLSPGTRYYYRIPGFFNGPASFQTAPSHRTGNFTFLLYGDSRETERVLGNEHIPLIKQAEQNVNVTDLAFTINTGDLSGTHDSVIGWNLHFLAIKPLATHAPYMVASGNHEWNGDSPYDQVDQPANWIQEFPMQDHPAGEIGGLNETSFAFGYGCAYFIFLGEPHTGSAEPAVLDWLEAQLAYGNASYKFTFLSFHRPPFDRREHAYNDDQNVLENHARLFYLGGVDAVFNGHNHVLAHQEVRWDPTKTGDPNARNITYLISGAGGASTREPKYGTWENNYNLGFYGRTRYCEEINHFYKIAVDGAAGTATFTAIDIDGNVVYPSFTLSSFK